MTDRINSILAAVVLAGTICALAVPEPAAEPEEITGVVEVVTDGDTIQLGPAGRRVPVRLWGIDAPEFSQTCETPDYLRGPRYQCGQVATARLYEMIARDRRVTCRVVDRDRYGRIVAVCRNSNGDLAKRLVAQGWAVDYPRYSRGAYADAEAAARAEKLGIHAGTFRNPADVRRHAR